MNKVDELMWIWIISATLFLSTWLLFFAGKIKDKGGVFLFSIIVIVFAFIVKNEGLIIGISLSATSLEIKKDLETAQSYLDSIRVVRDDIEQLTISVQENTKQVDALRREVRGEMTGSFYEELQNSPVSMLLPQLREIQTTPEDRGLVATWEGLEATSKESRKMHFYKAIMHFSYMINSSIDDSDKEYGYFYRANAYGWMGLVDSAIADFNRSLTYKPDFGTAWLNLGGYLNEAGVKENDTSYFPIALKAFDSAAKYGFAEDVTLWLNRAAVHQNMKHYDMAASFYDSAMHYGYDSSFGWNRKGIVQYKAGEFEDAIDSYEKSLNMYPREKQPVILCNKAYSYDSLGLYGEALMVYDTALAIDSCYLRARAGKASILARLGQLSQAITCCDFALRCDSSGWRYEHYRECRDMKDSLLLEQRLHP